MSAQNAAVYEPSNLHLLSELICILRKYSGVAAFSTFCIFNSGCHSRLDGPVYPTI